MILPRPCPSASWLLRTFIIFWRWKNDQFQRNFRSKLKILDSKIFLSNLESEGQRRGIIMGVTRLLLLEPFYYIALYWGIDLWITLQIIGATSVNQTVVGYIPALFALEEGFASAPFFRKFMYYLMKRQVNECGFSSTTS